ncbi:hypothetical protein PaSha_20445 [Pseudonocardia alni]|nr:hypothetical protein PaSha_20445 [Pseudonocardia alni]
MTDPARPGPAVQGTDDLDLPAPDGVRLAATLVRPAAATWPAVLIRTPYGRGRLLPEARGWAAHGFGCLVVDVRGAAARRGVPALRPRDRRRRRRARRAARDPGCDGRVVLAGASYGRTARSPVPSPTPACAGCSPRYRHSGPARPPANPAAPPGWPAGSAGGPSTVRARVPPPRRRPRPCRSPVP